MRYDTLVAAVRDCKACTLGSQGAGVPGCYFTEGVREGEDWNPGTIPDSANGVTMIIAEAPGGVEQRVGWPVQGESGQLLHSLLKECGLKFYYVSNIAKHRPWIVKGRQQKPDDQAIKACAPFIRAEIDMVRPSGLILMGEVAAWLVHPKNLGMKRLVGSTEGLPVRGGQIKTLVVYHTAYFLHNRTAPWINKQVREWKQNVKLFLGERPEEYRMEKIPCSLHPES